jgi:hypothetical protein
VGLERGPLSLVSTTVELLGRKNSGSGLENREYGRRDSSRWPRGIVRVGRRSRPSDWESRCEIRKLVGKADGRGDWEWGENFVCYTIRRAAGRRGEALGGAKGHGIALRGGTSLCNNQS